MEKTINTKKIKYIMNHIKFIHINSLISDQEWEDNFIYHLNKMGMLNEAEYNYIMNKIKNNRPQITVGEVIKFLKQYPEELPLYCAVSTVNCDEPEETQEFIDDNGKRPCIAIEACNKYITFGYIK